MQPMTPHSALPQPLWATSADGQGPDTRPTELDELCTHMHHCSAAQSRLAELKCKVVLVRGFVLGHFVSSLAVVMVVLTAGWLLIAP
jgi:hypothetical protein